MKGSSDGNGLGNEFLSNISATDGIYQVVRAFPGDHILHTEGDMDPLRDMEIIRDELIAKDIQSLEKRTADYTAKAGRSQDPEVKKTLSVLQKL